MHEKRIFDKINIKHHVDYREIFLSRTESKREEMNIFFDIVLKLFSVIGGASGFILFINWINKAKLEIIQRDKDDMHFIIENKGPVNITRLRVKNTKKITAKNAVVVLNIIDDPHSPDYAQSRNMDDYYLHWPDTPTREYFSSTPINIFYNCYQYIDVIFVSQDSEYGGCWIATPAALNKYGRDRDQYYLWPGSDYILEIRAFCENGKGDKKRFSLVSPQKSNWDDLRLRLLPMNESLGIPKIKILRVEL